MAWQSGTSLHGDRYTILNKLGSGGFGITYLAQDQQGRQVAIKTLKDEVMTDPEHADYRDKYLRNFKDEALSLAVCRHPHIVQIENVFHDQGLPCIVMEYIVGLDLGQRLKQQGPLSEAAAVRYVQQVGAGLSVVHQKGRLHRDIKPQNIMVRADRDEAVLIDFGIAREFLPDATQTHTLALTPGFAPIEQYDEQARRGEFTDVYALAATLSALVTGSSPPPSFMRAVRDRFQVPESCSAAVRNAIAQGMMLEPEARSKTVGAWLKLLQPPKPKLWIPAVPARYQRLAALLKAGNLREADIETTKQMLVVANRTRQAGLNIKDIEYFSCKDLRVINQLWVRYSQGRFGFSVQKQIYQALGGTREYSRSVWEAFAETVGWQRKDRSWLYYKEMNFNIQAEEGHLPCCGGYGCALWGSSRAALGSFGWFVLLSRIQICRL